MPRLPIITEGSGSHDTEWPMPRSASGASSVSDTSTIAHGSDGASDSCVLSVSSSYSGHGSANSSSSRRVSRHDSDVQYVMSSHSEFAPLSDYDTDDHFEAGIGSLPPYVYTDDGSRRHSKLPKKKGGKSYYLLHPTQLQKRDKQQLNQDPSSKNRRRCLPSLRLSRREASIAFASCFLTLFCLLYGFSTASDISLYRLTSLSASSFSAGSWLSGSGLGAHGRLSYSQLRAQDQVAQPPNVPQPTLVDGSDNLKPAEALPAVLPLPLTDTNRLAVQAISNALGFPNGNVMVLNETMPSTKILAHIPGWTLFENVYMYDGALIIISNEPESTFPERRMMTCSGLPADNVPGNVEYIDIWTRDKAELYFGNRILPIPGFTHLWNDPKQFLNHYYHFAAEIWLGAWRVYSAWAPRWLTPTAEGTIPDPDRIVMPHTEAREWRDGPNLNSYYLRATFPNINIEVKDTWEARSKLTKGRPGERNLVDGTIEVPGTAKVWRFDRVLLASRSAAFRGPVTGQSIHRTAGAAFALTKGMDTVREFGEWWNPLRKRVLQFAGQSRMVINYAVYPSYTREIGAVAVKDGLDDAGNSMPIVITYLSRQNVRRHLLPEDHVALVAALKAMCEKNEWEFVLFEAERMTQDEQLLLASRTTVLVGVHGNGLTHLLAMPPTPQSAVIEIFYPQGFAHDYQWTAEAVGLKHYAIWNDTIHTSPKLPWVNYPDGFQQEKIPVHAPAVVNLIEQKVNGKRPTTEYPMPCEEMDCNPRLWIANKD